jgi:hypothetical protein
VDRTYFYKVLRQDVERKFGSEIKYTKQCQFLAKQIFDTTDRQLSVSTIKRVFGIIQSSFNPSKFTLDTLAFYAGYETWNIYLKGLQNLPAEELEAPLNDNIRVITENSFDSILHKTRYDSRNFIPRAFAKRYLEKFLKSDKTATMLVAPKGCGKSSILLQWFGNHSSYTRLDNYTICLIDGGIFFAIYNLSGSPVILNQLIDFDVKECPEVFMKGKKDIGEERYIIVVDDIDEVFQRKEKYFSLVKNIMQILLMNKGNPSFKMIFTCRPENLEPFTSLINQNSMLADLWYQVHFFNQNHLEAINILFFNQKEINTLTRLNNIMPYGFFNYYHPDLLDVICHPQYFTIARDHFATPGSTEASYLDNLIQQIIYSPSYTAEKKLLIKKFLRLCMMAEETDFVDKESLIEESDCPIAYQELLASGVFYEFFETKNSFDVHIKVRFSNARIFEHLLLRFITQRISADLKFIEATLIKYDNNPDLKSRILTWFIKQAFSAKNYSLLKLIYRMAEQMAHNSEKPNVESIPEICLNAYKAFIICHRNDPDSLNALLPSIAKNQLGRFLYYEEMPDMDNLKSFPLHTLTIYQECNPTVDGKVIASFIKFIRGFYIPDEDSCKTEWEKVQKLNSEELTNPVAIRHYYSMAFLHATYFTPANRQELLAKVLSKSDELRAISNQKATSIPYFELTVLYYLNTCNLFKEIQALSKHLESFHIPTEPNSSCYWQYYKLCLARSFLHTGNPTLALEIYRQIRFIPFPSHMRHFMQLNIDLNKVEFLVYRKKNKEAIKLIQDTKILANFLNYGFIVKLTDELESTIFRKNLS